MTLADQLTRNDPFMVGFDRIFDRMHTLNLSHQKQSNYPPYNIVKKDDEVYVVEIAVAGFKQSEIDITLEDGVLKVVGEKETEDTTDTFIHKGIGARDFIRSFTLSDTIVVQSADLTSGILSITLENVIPEEKKPRRIEIGSSETVFLQED
jgi:molecular chaperone IbpA